ncbi:MAG TPA: YncE family protein [Longimicrobiales bacterium]|nr:YncE family protein [Longimicrobiales bacterium]
MAAWCALAALTVASTGCVRSQRTTVAVPPGAIMAAAPVDQEYLAIVVSEAVDQVSFIRFGADGAVVERQHEVGMNRADPDGPHGVAVSPAGDYYYVTTGHGTPNGVLWKLRLSDSRVMGRTELGLFPASLQVSPDGHYAYIVNFNLHGDMVPSSVSIVSTAEMVEVARLTTCTMPHGSRTNPQGTRHYSACMMDDILVEIDTREFRVARHFMLAPGREHGMSGPPGSHGGHAGAGSHTDDHAAAGHAPAGSLHAPAECSPTWAATSPDGDRVFVACNRSNDIVEIDVEGWTLIRRIPAGDGVYNLAATPDGRLLVATNKRGRSVSIFDLADGRERARIATQRPVVHGVAITADSRYAFISVEGIGSEPGTVEVLDLRSMERVASADVGQMATGIDVFTRVP